MFDSAAIRIALKNNLQALATAENMQLSEYMLGEPMPPFIEIMGADEIAYDIALQRGGDQNDMIVRAFVGLAIDKAAQIKLDRLLNSSGPSSMKQAIESDDTLGGNCDDLRVRTCTGYQIFPRGDGRAVLGASWTVQVETTG